MRGQIKPKVRSKWKYILIQLSTQSTQSCPNKALGDGNQEEGQHLVLLQPAGWADRGGRKSKRGQARWCFITYLPSTTITPYSNDSSGQMETVLQLEVLWPRPRHREVPNYKSSPSRIGTSMRESVTCWSLALSKSSIFQCSRWCMIPYEI